VHKAKRDSGVLSARVDDYEVVWHDVECGAYVADLSAWTELAKGAGGPVLELGCGAGRVSLRLAEAGFDVTGIDTSPPLVAAMRERVAAAGVAVDGLVGDARELSLERRFALICAPMQLLHLMGGAAGRARLLGRVTAHLEPGGAFAAAILTEDPVPEPGAAPPLPDVLERGGHVFSSLPLEVRNAGAAIEVRRLRQLVSPGGELVEGIDVTRLDRLTPSALEDEARSPGLAARERIDVPATADHVGSTIVVLEAR
jgi:SAM-dependent methyltransferase